MGEIAAIYDIMPGSVDVDLEGIVAELPSIIPEGVRIMETRIEAVAFGLRKIVAGFIINDEDESIGSKLEAALAGINGVENVENTATTNL
ncbi:MAG: translation elongation factor EF-1beta [Thermoplasmatales archaeon]|nr:translation elongation factor EF-1beta [Thermoplasmatales archaeon]